MLVIVALIAFLSLVEASLKTPRTANLISTPSPSSHPGSIPTTTTTTIPPFITTVSAPSSHSASGPATLRPSATAETNVVVPVSASGADDPAITPSPELDLGAANFHGTGMGAKFVQTTYWSCVTFPLETHCGWHEPILDAGAARMVGCDGGRAVLRAGVVAGVVGGLILGA
ncbi:hypothetical protein F4779DRAFT_614315 [Xylariaceae sp. FL0662B]|nr:hypothetical protein F4779DRAFT_614315 [Xylariaceae sp. FL0662B]